MSETILQKSANMRPQAAKELGMVVKLPLPGR